MTKPFEGVDYAKVFAIPKDYKPPKTYEDMVASLDYPNLNSIEYREKPVEICQLLQPFYDIICVSDAGYFILVTNDYQGRLWYGNVFAFENFQEFMGARDIKRTLYKTFANSNITSVKLLDNDLMLFPEITGKLQLYSLKNGISNRFSIFNTCSVQAHSASINAFDVMRADKKKLVTGCGAGHLKIFDIGSEDLKVKIVRGNAHFGNISGVSTSATNPNLYVTCSYDRSALVWDERARKPALGIIDNHKSNFSTTYWTTHEENKELVMTGDNAGWIQMFDIRKPQQILGEHRINKNIVHGFHFRKARAVITSNAYTTEVYKFQDKEMRKVLDEKADGVVRSATWLSDDEFVAVGWGHFSAHCNLKESEKFQSFA